MLQAGLCSLLVLSLGKVMVYFKPVFQQALGCDILSHALMKSVKLCFKTVVLKVFQVWMICLLSWVICHKCQVPRLFTRIRTTKYPCIPAVSTIIYMKYISQFSRMMN